MPHAPNLCGRVVAGIFSTDLNDLFLCRAGGDNEQEYYRQCADPFYHLHFNAFSFKVRHVSSPTQLYPVLSKTLRNLLLLCQSIVH